MIKINGVGHSKVIPSISRKKEYDMKIAVFRRGGLGDGLLETSIISGIRNKFPNSHITAYTDTTFTQILQSNIHCNIVVPVEWKRYLATEIDVRNHYINLHDLWFDVKPLQFLEGSRSAEFLAANLRNEILDIESRYYTFNGQEIVNFYEKMNARGQIDLFEKLFNIEVKISDTFILSNESENMKLPKQYAVISAGWTDTSFYKAWNKEKWEEICKYLNTLGICPVQIGKSNEPVMAGAVVATHLPLSQQYSVVQNSKLFLGSDGFFTHIAAKYEKPSIVLWGITPWQVWGHKNQYDVISPKFECLWWTHYNWAHDSRCSEIMNAITIDMVKEKIDKLLSELC